MPSSKPLFSTSITRIADPEPVYPLIREMWVQRGDMSDWNLLSDLHYKMESLPVGAKYWKLTLRGETIGVCVMGMSRPLLKERHAIFPKLTPGNDTQISNIHRYSYVNAHFRVVGRFVLDTMFRSCGAAYRFLNLACRMHGFTFAEIQSSMSKYNYFAQRAGFTMVKPIRGQHYDLGLKFMRRWFAAHPADIEAIMEEFAGFSPARQKAAETACKTFYYDHSSLEKTGSRRFYSERVVDHWPTRRTIAKIQGLCFARPLYGLYRNPDAGRRLPERILLPAFDLQKPDTPLDLDALAALIATPEAHP